MFDKTFFKFALGFTAIILFSMGTLYLAGHFNQGSQSAQATLVK